MTNVRNLTVKEVKEQLEKYPEDYEFAIEKEVKNGTNEWVLAPKTHRYMRFVIYER